ncbi:MAG: hypothetical protein ABJA66_02570 [Actinomycetota bacterium]
MGIVMKYLVCIMILSLFGCSHEIVTTKTEAQNKTSVNDSTSMVEQKKESPVKVTGDFTNVKSDGEHQQGYSVKLWKQDDKFYGLISGSGYLRQMGDPPKGILENVRFDPQSNKLSFQSKLLLALIHDRPDSGYVPSWGFYEFEGILTNNKLEGNIKVTDQLCGNKCPDIKKITLRRSKKWSLVLSEYQSYIEWKTYVDEITEVQIPK